MRHRTDPGALLAGLYFGAVAVIFLILSLDHRDFDLIPLASAMAIGFAAVLLVRVFTRARRRD